MHNRHEGRQRHGGDFRREDDINWNDRDRSRDETRSWAGDRDFQRTEGYRQTGGQYAREEDSRAYRDRAEQGRSSYDQYGYGAQPYEQSRSYGAGETWGRGPGRLDQSARSDEFGHDSGVNRAYGRDAYSRDEDYGRAYRATSHAPGSRIWEGSGSDMNRRDFEPDYLHWREQQISKFDRDYDEWRSERRQKFSSDFDTWRSSRADNPIVGDVADGGVGSQKDLKKS